MVEAFIRNNGVTKCPSYCTPEFRDLNIAREQARAEEAVRNSGRWARNRKRNLRRALA